MFKIKNIKKRKTQLKKLLIQQMKFFLKKTEKYKIMNIFGKKVKMIKLLANK